MKQKSQLFVQIFRDLTINIVASLILSAVVIGINKNFLNLSLPLWIVLVIIFSLVPLVYQSYRYGLNRALPKNRVFIISSALYSAPFFAELLKHLCYKLELLGYIPEIKVSQEDFNVSELNRHVDFIKENKKYYIGGFLIHSDIASQFEKYQEFGNTFKKPLIFLDTKKSDLLRLFSNNCSFISYNNLKTGQIAAEFIIKSLRARNVIEPHILVIASKMQTERQENFKLAIEGHYTNSHLEINEFGNFNRRQAFVIAYDDLKQRLSNNLPIWDAIFCTNDEMALGVLYALNDLKSKKLSKIILVGVDGIEQAQREISKGNCCFVNTVDQNPKQLVEEGIAEFLNKLSSSRSAKEKYIEPKLYK